MTEIAFIYRSIWKKWTYYSGVLFFTVNKGIYSVHGISYYVCKTCLISHKTVL